MRRAGYIIFLLWSVTVQGILSQPFYQVTPLLLNYSFSNEIFAYPYDNGLIFCSDRRTNILVSRVDSTNHQLFHLFYAPKKDSLKWGASRLLSRSLPIDAHQGPCSVSADGQDLYFTANNEGGQRIYIARKVGENWENIRPFVHNNPKYTTTSPSVSRDGKYLFFASDMPGGHGGFDIYVCEWTPRGWGTPKNLGAEVNTTDNELYPFIQGNGILYFSSNGRGSIGGMDIFSAHEANGVWGMVQHLEEPINSTADDLAYVAADNDGISGYLSSNRDGKYFGLFSFQSLFPTFATCQPQEENDYSWEFFDENAVGLDTASFKYVWDLGDGTIIKGETAVHTFASTGQYVIQLNVVDSLTGEVAKQVTSYVMDVTDIEQPYITVDETTLEAGKPVAFDALKTYLPELDIEGYYWIFSDGVRIKGERVEHVFASPGVYQVQLGVVGKLKQTGQQAKVCSFREITVR